VQTTSPVAKTTSSSDWKQRTKSGVLTSRKVSIVPKTKSAQQGGGISRSSATLPQQPLPTSSSTAAAPPPASTSKIRGGGGKTSRIPPSESSNEKNSSPLPKRTSTSPPQYHDNQNPPQNGQCEFSPCLNDGECVLVDSKRFTCKCKEFFFGVYCEISKN
jgi:hypothetical protein